MSYQDAEITDPRHGLQDRPNGLRLNVRRVKPSRRDAKKLTTFEKKTGWRYQIVATNIPLIGGLRGVTGSGQAWFVAALYRDHAEVEDRVKTMKRIGLGLLPSTSWQANTAWILAATIAVGLDAWMRLLLRHDQDELVHAEPESIRMKLYRLPARLTAHARRGTLHLDQSWPWAPAFCLAWQRALQLPAVTRRPAPPRRRPGRRKPHHPRARGTRCPRSACDGLSSAPEG